jgi:transcriptional regulator with XRE-family HTH domain
VSKRTWWRLENGDREPSALELQRIAAATSQPLSFFLADASSVDDDERASLPLPLPLLNPEEGDDERRDP